MGYANTKIVKNSIFLKVQEGTPHTIRLLDEDPTEQWQHKIGTDLKMCGGEACVYCDDGHSKSQRFVTNVYDHTEGRTLLWSYGPTVAETLKSIALGLAKDEMEITDHDLELTVKGSGLQKKTSVQLRIKSSPVPEGVKLHSIGPKEEIAF